MVIRKPVVKSPHQDLIDLIKRLNEELYGPGNPEKECVNDTILHQYQTCFKHVMDAAEQLENILGNLLVQDALA